MFEFSSTLHAALAFFPFLIKHNKMTVQQITGAFIYFLLAPKTHSHSFGKLWEIFVLSSRSARVFASGCRLHAHRCTNKYTRIKQETSVAIRRVRCERVDVKS